MLTQNFSTQNLQGRSFRDQDLTGANFREADIRGVDFTNAKLRGADFTEAKAGLTKYWSIVSLALSLVLAAMGGLACGLAALVATSTAIPEFRQHYTSIPSVILFTLLFLFCSATVLPWLISLRKNLEQQSLNFVLMYSSWLGSSVMTGGVSWAWLSVLGGYYPGIIGAAWAGAGTQLGCVLVVFILSTALAWADAIMGRTGTFLAFSTCVLFALVWTGCIVLGWKWQFVEADLATWSGVKLEINAWVISLFLPALQGVAAAVLITLPVTVICSQIAQQALAENQLFSLIRSTALAASSLKGTTFNGADLTDANFTQAILKNTDFRNAILTRTCWKRTQILNMARSGDTYLKNSQIRELVTTGEAPSKTFDRQDLRGLNLQEANLAETSFIDSDLSYTNLQRAKLYNAKLVRTNLDYSNLGGAYLTGVCIEDWGITRKTKLDNVECQYVYMKLLTKENSEPQRMPPFSQGEFEDNDFRVFITSILDTLDLYHKQEINSSVAITVLKGMTSKYPIKFEVVGLENRGNRQFVIRLKVYGQTSHFQIEEEYYSRYVQTLMVNDPKKLLLDSDTTDTVVTKLIEAVNQNPGTQIVSHQGIVITGGNVSVSQDKIQQNFYSPPTGVAGKVEGDQNIYASEQKKTLAEAAQEIQNLLKQLEKSNPGATEIEKVNFVTNAIPLSHQQRFLSALDAGWKEAVKELLDNAYVNVAIAVLEGWRGSK